MPRNKKAAVARTAATMESTHVLQCSVRAGRCWRSRRASRAAAAAARRAPGTTRSRRCWWRGRPRAPGSWP
ncbi:hypothetical protein G6F35_019032 [Rhizopus arrhizus]|nr:hypothetical protein G6F35_019032 [Rhizopus arrhizus]KAG1248686.1 hypothetical protein G6F65_019485 [Rhizopus arrhizus]